MTRRKPQKFAKAANLCATTQGQMQIPRRPDEASGLLGMTTERHLRGGGLARLAAAGTRRGGVARHGGQVRDDTKKQRPQKFAKAANLCATAATHARTAARGGERDSESRAGRGKPRPYEGNSESQPQIRRPDENASGRARFIPHSALTQGRWNDRKRQERIPRSKVERGAPATPKAKAGPSLRSLPQGRQDDTQKQ